MLLVNQTRWEFISLDEEFFSSDCEAVQLCVLGPYSIIPNLCNKPLPHQIPALGPTLYKFIVMVSLGLDLVHKWAQSENCDPTIGVVCGELLV